MPQAMAQGCPLVAKPPVLANETVSQAINGTFDPDEEIDSIQVTVVTGTGLFSGTTDDVWFDLGPRAWKLGEKFEEGSTKTFELKVYDPYFEGAGNGRLRIRDLIYARIEKKGICGLTNAPDSLLDLVFPGGATPANLLPSVRALIEQAGALRDTDSAVNLAIDTKNRLQNNIVDTQARIRAKEQEIESGAIQTVEKVACPDFIPTFLNPACVIEKETKAFIDARNFIAGLLGQVDDLSKEVAKAETAVEKASADKAHALATLQASLADKAVQFGLNAAGPALDKLQEVASELDDLIKKAAAGLSVPQPGQWNLKSVSIAINGKQLLTFQIEGGRLKRDQPSVTYYFRRSSPAELFVYGLRTNINKQSAHSDEAAAGITTTFFKDNNISGWESRPLSNGAVIGTLRHLPSPGTDGFVSLDLQVMQVEAGERVFALQHAELPRFLRIEYLNRTDMRYHNWGIDTMLRVAGPVEWDTDQYGFYELHPTREAQVRRVGDDASFLNAHNSQAEKPFAGGMSGPNLHPPVIIMPSGTQNVRIAPSLPRDTVFFEWGRSQLTERSRRAVKALVEASKQTQYPIFEVNGYTDTSGLPMLNLPLSRRRAEVVRSAIIANGVNVEAVRATGLADGFLLVPTGPGVREAKNRRTEIIVHSGRPDTD